MMYSRMMIYFVSLLPFVHSEAEYLAECPRGCTCIGANVGCHNILNLKDIDERTQFLNLTNNGIGSRKSLFSDSFAPLKSLKILILSNNDLQDIPDGLFKNLKLLEILDLSYNSIGNSTPLAKDTFTPLINLRELVLSHNQLELIPIGAFDDLKALRLHLLDISHNPLECDCDLLDTVRGIDNLTEACCWLGAVKYNINTLNCSELPDNCAGDPSKCSPHAECLTEEDYQGEYSICECKDGFDGNGIVCEDIDECEYAEDNECHSKATCANTVGSYTCQCRAFYQGDGFNCEDIDDCLDPDRCNPDEVCENLEGGFNCNCHRGYMRASVNPDSTCRDIDECTETETCSKLANCTNSIGSYDCGPCADGYVGDGKYCNVACDQVQCGVGFDCFNIRPGPLCRCPFGMYNATADTCAAGGELIEIGNFKVKKYFTQGLRRFNSPAFLEYAVTLEPVMLRYLQAEIPSVLNVQMVKMGHMVNTRLISYVQLVVLLEKNHEVTPSEVETMVYKGLQDGKFIGTKAEKSQSLIVKHTDMCALGMDDCGEYFRCIEMTSLKYKCECFEGYVEDGMICVKNLIGRNIIIAVMVLLLLAALIFIIVYMRKKKYKSDTPRPLTKGDQKVATFQNAAFNDGDQEEYQQTTSL